MSCVNINSKEFKKLVEDTGISAGNLELIIHDYQNNQGNEGNYPSIEYIMNKLTGTNEVISDAQVELWEKKYSIPKVFKDKQNLEAAVSEASRYYSKEAITTWEDNEGNYVMKVAEPQLTGEAVEKEYEKILANAPRDKEGRLLAPNDEPSNLNERQYAQVRSKAFKRWFGDWENNPENASKVVDENGEPKIVYHGSKTKITTFDSSKSDAINELSKIIKSTNFFSDDKTVADFFAKTEKQSVANAIAASLNEIEEAQVEDENEVWNYVANSVNKSVDWVKNFWLNELSFEERMDASDGIMYDPEVEKQKYQVFLNLKNPIIIDAKGERADKVLEENKEVINNSDEVIILNIDETVGRQETATDYLVRKANQIKSATENIGTFEAREGNIYQNRTSPVISNQRVKIEAELVQLKREHRDIINELKDINSKLNTATYEDEVNTEEGTIKIEQKSNDRDAKSFYVTSGNSIFNRVSLKVTADVNKGIIGGAVLLPSINEDSNYKKLDNPIKENHANILKSILKVFIDNGHKTVTSEWSAMVNPELDDYNLNIKNRLDTLSNILGFDVSDYIILDIRNNKEKKQMEERVIVKTAPLYDAIKENLNSTIYNSINNAIENTNASKINSEIANKALNDKRTKLEESSAEYSRKIYDLEQELKNIEDSNNELPFSRKVTNILEHLKNLQWIEEYNREDFKHGTLRKEHNKYYITLGKYFKDERAKVIRNKFKQALQNQGIPVDSFVIEGIKLGKHEHKILEVSLKKDAISRDTMLLGDNLREKRRMYNSMLKIYSFLQERIPSLGDLHFISREEAAKRGFDDNTNAYVENGEVYIIGGRGNLQIVSEEGLHILINYVQKANSNLFNSLLKEAKESFPQLYAEIEVSYKDKSQEVRDNELVTQALARYFVQEYESTEENNRKTFAQRVEELFSFLAEFFNSFFKNNVIDAKDLQNLSLQDLAQLLNTSDSTWLSEISNIKQENRASTSTNKEIFYSEKEANQFIKNLREYENYSDNDIKVQYFKGTEDLDEYWEVTYGKIDATNNNPVNYTLHSGGAPGSDTTWGEIGAEFGIGKSNHYYTGEKSNYNAPNGNAKLSEEDYREGAVEVAKAAKYNWGYQYSTMKDPRLIRNWAQVKYADAIFAIGSLVKPGERVFPNQTNDTRVATNATVTGGTGYAVGMAILHGKPVYVYDQNRKQWYKNIDGKWSESEVPTLTPNFAGIGTREINEDGKKAIREVYEKAFKSTQNQPVAESPTQEENTAETQQSSNEEFAKESQSITKQIDNLIDSNIISASEVRHIAEQIVYTISDIITECQTIPGRMVELFGDRFKDFDAENATRVGIAKKIGPNDLIKFAKLRFKDFDSSNTEGNKASYKTLKKARLILQNWKALMYLATDVFANVESFTIVGNEVREDINADADNFNESNNQDDIGEVEGDTQEHWQIETKTLDVLNSMSQLVRQALLKCYLLETTTDSEGNITYKKVKSEFNIDERVNPRDATNSILRWVQGSITLEDMITKLQTKVDSNPWVSQLIDRLTDTSGKESDFQSQFFGVFNKHFQSYSVVIKENGIYKSIIVNEFPALREAYNSITTQYKIGEHPMFGLNGVNKKTFKEFKEIYEELLPHRSKFENADLQEVSRLLAFAYNALGYYVNPEMVTSSLNSNTFKKMLDYMGYMINSIEKNIDNKNYDPFKFKAEGSISKNIKEFLRPITDKLEDTAVSSFYDSGKMYQSYITPSYMTKLMNKFNLKGDEFDDFIKEEYGKYEWFKYKSRKLEDGWRNTWLELLVTDENAREIFKHKVQLNFNKHNYMKNMSDTEYTLSLLAEYYSETADVKQSRVPAWFRVPMLSNKPSSEFIKFYSERGVNYKETITKGLKMIFDQELSRIQTVNMRAFNKKDARFIKNFEVNGKKFNFLDFMNDYLTGKSKDSELGKLIKSKVNGTRLTSEQETALNELALKAIREAMDNKVTSVMKQWKDSGIIEGAKQIENISKEDSEVEEKLTNFIWNDTFAAMNIIQLTVTDITYYKDAEDLQKRLAQIHAPGVRAYVEAKDYAGNRVTDGYERTIYLKDFDSFKSNIIENVNIVFERKINSAKTEQEKSTLIALKESLTKEPVYNEKGEEEERGGSYWYINVADAQGFNSPTSYRKKAFVFGKWSKEAEEVYQNLKSGNYNYSDLQVAFQPLKPFVYSQIDKSSNVKDAPLSTLKVPVQNKNSEYLLIMADAILQGEDTGRPNLLRAIFEIMEESAEADNTKGIDTVQFESTVKSGLMGAIDINKFQYAEDGEAMAKAAMRAAIYANGKNGEYNNSVVHKIPFEDYCLQQEVPAHFRNHEQAHGSQIRFIIPSDLEETNYLGEAVTYEVEGRQLTAEEFKSEYEDTIAANINDSIEILSNELHLTGNLKDRNIALSKILQREIIQSPRYGVDLLQACSVDENGNFRIPLGDPIQSKRVEQLINSIIKNRVNKQTIAGGPVVQVSNFGTSRELNIRFKSKELDENNKPKLLLTRKEFKGTDEQYKEYINENQAGIAYFEVFAPIYINDLFLKFQNPDGSIDIESIEATNPDLLKMVGYRIPTEDKYSMAPLKIVGFLPREAGDGIMMPNDITLLTGSDFDVDKMYLMRKEIPLKEKPRKERNDLLYDAVINQVGKVNLNTKQDISSMITKFLDKVAEGDMNFDQNELVLWDYYKSIAYIAESPTKGRSYRNNKIVDMTYEVLTHETTADKVLNPGGFDPQKKMGYMVSAFKNPSNNLSWEELSTKSIDDLKDLSYTDKNLCYIDVHTQFYKQNNAAGALIGMFAVHKVAHAVLEGNGYMLDVDSICSLTEPFFIAGMEFGGYMHFDSKYDKNGQLIGKSLGCLVASAVDAVKDPVLNLMNINGNTATILNALIRMGMPFEDAALFLSQSSISNALSTYNKESITNYTKLSDVITKRINDLESKFDIEYTSQINSEPLTKEELIEGIKDNPKAEIEYKVLKAFQRVQKISEALKGPTFATRFNSISSAVGPLIIDNLITEHKLEQFSDHIIGPNGKNIDITDILRRHPILGQFYRTLGIAKQLFRNMPANSTGFRKILDSMDDNISNLIFSDRKLLSSLSDFYQSYLMIASGVIKESQLDNYIKGFPAWFFKENVKEKYKDNALIQAIKLDVDKNTGRAVLKIDITGLDTQQKELLSTAWVDLHKKDPDLSIKLFTYNFFRKGVGFSPKTFMSLVPTYVKERIPGYIETYKNLPQVSPEVVLDQFVRNNWDNNKLVPKKTVKYKKHDSNKLEIYKEDEVKEMSKVPYFKISNNGVDTLWKQIGKTETAVYYEEINPLGNNGEYLEISTSYISKAKEIPAVAKESQDAEQLNNLSSQELEFDNTPSTIQSKSDVSNNLELLYRVMENNITVTSREQAIAKVKEYKNKSAAEKKSLESGMKKYIKNRFEKLNIPYDESKIDEIYKLIC